MGAFATRAGAGRRRGGVAATCSSPTAAASASMLPGNEGVGHGRHARQRARPHRPAVHQRDERLRHGRQRAGRVGAGGRRRASSTSAWPSASTSTHAACSTPTRPPPACPSGTATSGFMVTTQFFAMKINRYLHDHDISARDAREGGGQGVPQRLAQPERLAAAADQRGGDPRVAACSTTRSRSTCSARPTRAPPRWSCAGPTRPTVHDDAGVRARRRRAHPPLRHVRGVQPVAVRPSAPTARRSTRRGPSTSMAGIGPERHRRSPRSRTASPAPRSCTWPRTASAPTASRSA